MGTTKKGKRYKDLRVKETPVRGQEFEGFPEEAVERATSFRAEDAFRGKKSAGLTVIKQCGKWIAKGQMPPEGPIRDYFVRFCERIGDGEQLPKALGSKRQPEIEKAFRDFMIADEIDTLWLFGYTGDEDTVTQDKAFEIVRKKYRSHWKLSKDRINKIYKTWKQQYDVPDARDLCNIHDQKIMNRVTQRMRDKKESVDTAFSFVEAELNSRCKYSELGSIKNYMLKEKIK